MAVPMDEQSRPPEEPNLPRAHFHLTLALIFFPPAAIIGGWTLAILDVLRGYANRAQLTWTRLLVGLVVVDALVVASLLWVSAHLDEFEPKADPKRSVIGVALDPGEVPRIREVPAGLPGARAGLRAGDVIEKVGGKPVATPKEAVDAIQALEPGKSGTLTVKRGNQSVDVPVTPEKVAPPGERGLFEVDPAVDFRMLDEFIVAQLPALVLVAVLAVLSRRKASTAVPVWSGFLVALIGSMAGSLGYLALARSSHGGLSLGTVLISLLVQTVLMLALTAAARKWLSREVPEPAPTLTPLRAGLQGFFYLITSMPRIGILLLLAVHFLAPDGVMGDPMVAQLSEARFGVLGGVLLVVGVALVGPLAEEFLFRGYLLPRLVRQWGELPALASSSLLFAILHLRDGPFMLVIFIYGWIFGWARLRSGGIGASTALHMAVNSFVAAAILFQGMK
jgi:membrane protease YdiL (CAAX protease family)